MTCCVPAGLAEEPPPVGGGGSGELPVLGISPSSVTLPFESTSITISDADSGLWAGTEQLSVHLYPLDEYGCPVGEPVYSSNGITPTDAYLVFNFESSPLIVPGDYAFIISDGTTSTPLGQAFLTVEASSATVPAMLIAIPDYGLPGETVGIYIEPSEELNLWSVDDPITLRLVRSAETPEQTVPVEGFSVNSLEVAEDAISADITLSAAIAPGSYTLEVLLGEAVIGTAPFELLATSGGGGGGGTSVLGLSLNPYTVPMGSPVSLEFSLPLESPMLQNPYGLIFKSGETPVPVGNPSVLITTTDNSQTYYTFNNDTILTEAGDYALYIFEGPPNENPQPVAVGLFTVLEPNLDFVTEELPLATVNQPYEATIEVINGSAPYNWGIFPPEYMELPQGMTLIADAQDSSKAVLSFTPGKCGPVPVIIKVTNSNQTQTVTGTYQVSVLPPAFATITPELVYAGDSLDFTFTLPAEITVTNPYAVLFDDHFNYIWEPFKVSCSEGQYQVSFPPGMLYSGLCETYAIALYEGIPYNQEQWQTPLAAGLFAYKELPIVEIDPDTLAPGYVDQSISLNREGLWNESEALTVKIFKENCSEVTDAPLLEEVACFAGTDLQVTAGSITFTLPTGLDKGCYLLRVYNNEVPIANSFLDICYTQLDLTPQWVNNSYRDEQSMLLKPRSGEPAPWDPADILEIQIYKWNDDYETSELAATIPDEKLTKNDDGSIIFELPVTLDIGKYDLSLLRGTEVLGESWLDIYPGWFEVEPYRINTDSVDKMVTLYEDSYAPETWHASEANQLRIDLYKITYYGEECWEYNTEFATSVPPEALSVTEDQISFTLPDLASKGHYQVHLLRQIDATNWRTVATGDLLYRDPPIVLQPEGDLFSNPPTVKEGYSEPLNFTLTDIEGMAWSANENLVLNLYRLDRFAEWWMPVSPELYPYDVVVGENLISAKLPTDLIAGDYTLTVSRGNTYAPDEIAFVQFRILPELEIKPNNLRPALVNEPYQEILTVTGGEAPYSWYIFPPTLETQLPEGLNYYANQSDSSQLIITGTFTQPGSYPLVIRITENSGKESFYPTELIVREGWPRVIVGKTGGLAGREVILPIIGENLIGTGTAGIQFTLNYDPQFATIETEPDGVGVVTLIPNATVAANIDNVKGEALITVAASEIRTDKVEFCNIKFRLNSNPANPVSPITLSYLDGIILNDGFNNIPADIYQGEIRATTYGDVNGNGKVDVGDAVLILRHSAGKITLPEPLVELANVDGSIDDQDSPTLNPADAILVLKRVVRLISQFPVENQL